MKSKLKVEDDVIRAAENLVNALLYYPALIDESEMELVRLVDIMHTAKSQRHDNYLASQSN